MAESKRLLILGGTGEAAALAHRLSRLDDLEIVTSLAGRTRAPAAVPGKTRTGGFGGADGLADYLTDHAIDLVVDATHPYAAQITANGAAACQEVAVPRLLLSRPPWREQRNDRWIRAPDAKSAASVLLEVGRRVFLSTGRQDLAPFAALPSLWFLVRLIDEPSEPLPLENYQLILGRGPFAAADEAALMREHEIHVVLSKNSGGQATYGKIQAARELGLPVVMIDRPALPDGETVHSVDEAAVWVEARCRPAPEPPSLHP